LLARGQVQFVINFRKISAAISAGRSTALLVEADATDRLRLGFSLGSLEPLFDTALKMILKGRWHRSVQYRPDRSTRPCALQPGSCYPIQHRARADGRDLDHDNGDDHWLAILANGNAARWRISLNADTPKRSAHWKDSSLHFRRLHPGIGHSYRGLFSFHVPIRAAFFFCCWSRSCSSSQTWRWESPSPPSRKNQLQAVQMAFFVFLRRFALRIHVSVSRHARWPKWSPIFFLLTHFLRIVRGILLKGNGIVDITLQLWQIALFALVVWPSE